MKNNIPVIIPYDTCLSIVNPYRSSTKSNRRPSILDGKLKRVFRVAIICLLYMSVLSRTIQSVTGSTSGLIKDGQQRVELYEICGKTPLLWSRIIGGSETSIGESPWQVSLREVLIEGVMSFHRCGGALLHSKWVITAAHCAASIPHDKLIARVGEYNFNRADPLYPYVDMTVSRIVSHEKFNIKTFENDIALFELAKPIELAPHIIPICLAPLKNYTGSLGTITGWGLTSEGKMPTILHKVQVPFISTSECIQWFQDGGDSQDIEPMFICAGYKDGVKDACHGDSGGPIVQEINGRWALVSVISWGIGCGEKNRPGVSTFIPLFADWIRRNSGGDVYLPDFYSGPYGPRTTTTTSQAHIKLLK